MFLQLDFKHTQLSFHFQRAELKAMIRISVHGRSVNGNKLPFGAPSITPYVSNIVPLSLQELVQNTQTHISMYLAII